MRKGVVAFFLVITIVLSGVAGYCGSYLGNFYSNAELDARAQAALTTSEAIADREPENLDVQKDNSTTSKKSESDHIGFLPFSKTADSADDRELSVPEIAAIASSSVVEIYTERVVNSGRMGQLVTEGAGSGVIISPDGYIITNNHVIEGSMRITVRLNIGTDFEAELIGRDSQADIAVLKIKADDLQPIVYGDSDMLMVGEFAVAIGNPLGKLGGSVTEGVISALSRNIEIDGHKMTLLQTSAAINPGNSGGGLFNKYGELIGVVNAKSSGSDIEGIGFAIPVNLAKSIADALIEYGYVPGRIDFGATLIDILDHMTAMMYRVNATGVYISQVDPASALQSGDRIVSIDGKDVESIADINDILTSRNVGDALEIVVARNGYFVTVTHTLKQAMS